MRNFNKRHFSESTIKKIVFVLCLLGNQVLQSEEYKKFLIIISSNNKHLEEVFEQNYPYYRVVSIDSMPNNEEFISYKYYSEKFSVVYCPLRFGKIGTFWSIIHNSKDDEVVIDLGSNNFFLNTDALAILNNIYQKNDIWMTAGYFCNYEEACLFDPQNILDQNPWRLPAIGIGEPITFYAWLFKQIKLEDLTEKNDFLDDTTPSMYYPLFEMARKHLFFMPDSMINSEDSVIADEKKSEYMPQVYRTLPAKPCFKNDCADLVVFSYNRPMQLYAFLESVERYVRGVGTISVIYRTSNNSMQKGYKKVMNKFPNVHFLKQENSARGTDFKEKTLKASFETPNDYILFSVDDIIIKDYIDISECIFYLKETQAYGFYLRLGDNINHFYILDKPQKKPSLLALDDKVFAWRFNSGGGWDWNCFASVDMTIHEKKLIKADVENISFDRPNYFEGNWSGLGKDILNKFGLCYRKSKIVNLPLNKVQSDSAKNMGMTANELLHKFNEGYKIDINPLYNINNRSAHIEYVPTFVKFS